MKRVGLSMLLLASLVAFATAQSASSATAATAHYADFNLINNNWNFTASKVFCASALSNRPLAWRKEYGWAMYCSSNDPNPGEAICGKRLKVTNTETGAQETVRIFDTCGGDYLVLDLHTAFHQIDDTNKAGYNKGHLTVDYEFVDYCDGLGEDNVTVHYAYYDPEKYNYSVIPAECAARLANTSYEWRSKYGWTAFHGLDGCTMPDSCGKCLKVTNTANTSAETTVRIVDTSLESLELDKTTAFDKIDFDGSGERHGNLTVDYKFVDCEDDPEENIVLVSSL